MKKKNVEKSQSLFRRSLKILSIVIVIMIIAVAIVVVAALTYFKYWEMKNTKAEKLIDQKFHQEVAGIPQLQVKDFKLWEGDSLVVTGVVGKGEVSFWYGENGAPRIYNFAGHNTSFPCYFVDSDGTKTDYAFDTDLYLDDQGLLKKWFPFQVKNLSDLVAKYDQIAAVIATFPKNPKMIPFEDDWGKRDVVETSNPDFVIKQTYNGKEVWCDLYQ